VPAPVHGPLDGAGPTAVPRRSGWIIRARAKLRLLPTGVSTAALLTAKRVRILALGLGGYILFWSVLVVVAVSIGSGADTSRTAVVLDVVEAADADAAGAAFVVLLDDWAIMKLDREPGVEPGEVVGIEGPRYRPEGLTVDGEFVPSVDFSGSRTDPADLPVGLILPFGLVALAIALGPMRWSIQSVRRIRRDLASGSIEQIEGRYLGSWRWRGLASAIERRPVLLPVGAVPVAVSTAPGTIRWFIAPARAVEELVDLEHVLRRTTTAVTVQVHPSTGMIASLASADGEHHLELGSGRDTLGLDTGLPLVFSRRARRRRLPD
jgi:hypothetical protein